MNLKLFEDAFPILHELTIFLLTLLEAVRVNIVSAWKKSLTSFSVLSI